MTISSQRNLTDYRKTEEVIVFIVIKIKIIIFAINFRFKYYINDTKIPESQTVSVTERSSTL